MTQKNLSNWLKFIIVLLGLCGLVIYFFVFPVVGESIIYSYPEFSCWFWPWLIFIWTTAIPCYVVLGLVWSIAANIDKNNSFSEVNAKSLSRIAVLTVIDSIWFFVGNIVLLLLNMNHPSVILFAVLVIVFAITLAIAAAVLSHLVKKAADLQLQSDLTI